MRIFGDPLIGNSLSTAADYEQIKIAGRPYLQVAIKRTSRKKKKITYKAINLPGLQVKKNFSANQLENGTALIYNDKKLGIRQYLPNGIRLRRKYENSCRYPFQGSGQV